MKYKSNNNIVYSCKYRVVFCPKYRNETKEKQRQRMKQVWIFLAINLIWVIFCIFLFIKVIPPPSNADTSNKNPSPEYIEMLKDIRDQRPQ